MIQASNYDQSCASNSDCIAVGEGNACFSCLIVGCTNAAINVKAKPQYDADVAKTVAGQLASSPFCGCPMSSGPCCVGGVCRADFQCSSSADVSVDSGQSTCCPVSSPQHLSPCHAAGSAQCSAAFRCRYGEPPAMDCFCGGGPDGTWYCLAAVP
jgi:hypothetical protein